MLYIRNIRIMNLRSFIFTMFTGLFLISSSVMAEDNFKRSGFWGGIDIGAGFVRLSLEGSDTDENNFFLGFKGGYTLTPNFLMGLELSGWLIESSDLNDPSKGEGISQVFLITQYYPISSMGLFAKVGGGYVSHWNNRPGEPQREEGWGLTFGGGYDFSLNKNLIFFGG